MTHQQALAQVAARAVQVQSNMHTQPEHSSSVSAASPNSLPQVPGFSSNITQPEIPSSIPDFWAAMKESPDYFHSEQRLQSSSTNVINLLMMALTGASMRRNVNFLQVIISAHIQAVL